MKYEIGYHSGDALHPHVALINDQGERDELFDVALYHVDGENDPEHLESLAGLADLLFAANALLEGIQRLQRMAGEAWAEWEASEHENSDAYDRHETLNDALNVLQILAHGDTPAQGEAVA